MSSRIRPDGTPINDAPETPATPARTQAPERKGPDGFDQQSPQKRRQVALDARPPTPPPRGRILDPRLIPLVPPTVTTDPARQFHALLGLPPQVKKPQGAKAGEPKEEQHSALVVDLEVVAKLVSAPRAKLIRSVVTGAEGPTKKRLLELLLSPTFAALPEAEKRKALARLDLRPK